MPYSAGVVAQHQQTGGASFQSSFEDQADAKTEEDGSSALLLFAVVGLTGVLVFVLAYHKVGVKSYRKDSTHTPTPYVRGVR